MYTPWSTDVALERVEDTQALEYLSLYETDEVFSNPATFVTLRRSNSDLARFVSFESTVASLCAASLCARSHARLCFRANRSCIAFYDGGGHGFDLTDDLVVYPINPDSWMCNHLWDSNFVKVPMCGGRLAAQVRRLCLWCIASLGAFLQL